MLMNLLRSGLDFRQVLIYLLLFIPIYCISFSVHETAHGYVAWKLGDPTARNLGRLTLNPLKHLDPIGTVAMLLIGVGYAKPVPINTRYFKKPKRDMALSSAAGPLSNLLLALVGMVGYNLTNLLTPLVPTGLGVWNFAGAAQSGASTGAVIGMILMTFFYYFSWMNVSLAIFNLIPIPPFDGSRLAFVFLPDRLYWSIMKYERYIMIGLILLIYVLPFSIITPIAGGVLDGLYFITRWIALL